MHPSIRQVQLEPSPLRKASNRLLGLPFLPSRLRYPDADVSETALPRRRKVRNAEDTREHKERARKATSYATKARDSETGGRLTEDSHEGYRRENGVGSKSAFKHNRRPVYSGDAVSSSSVRPSPLLRTRARLSSRFEGPHFSRSTGRVGQKRFSDKKGTKKASVPFIRWLFSAAIGMATV